MAAPLHCARQRAAAAAVALLLHSPKTAVRAVAVRAVAARAVAVRAVAVRAVAVRAVAAREGAVQGGAVQEAKDQSPAAGAAALAVVVGQVVERPLGTCQLEVAGVQLLVVEVASRVVVLQTWERP